MQARESIVRGDPISAKLFLDTCIINHLLKCQFHPADVKVSLEYLDHASVSHEMVLRSDWRESFNVTLSTSNNVHHSFGGNESNDSNVEILSKDFYSIEK